jgi:hypothetical protein
MRGRREERQTCSRPSYPAVRTLALATVVPFYTLHWTLSLGGEAWLLRGPFCRSLPMPFIALICSAVSSSIDERPYNAAVYSLCSGNLTCCLCVRCHQLLYCRSSIG